MILPSQSRFDTLIAARRDARLHVEAWQKIVSKLDEEISAENYYLSALASVTRSNERTSTSEGRQGDNLPRNGKRDKPVRYHRGSKASDEGTLRK